MKIYDGTGVILGRLGAAVAKDALCGEEVKIINCEKVVISGAKAQIISYELQRRNRHGYPLKGPQRSNLPERYVRRAIRGMLPWKKARGKDAFQRILCYRGIPAEFANITPIVLSTSTVSKLPTLKYATVSDVCKGVGSKA